MKRIGLFLLLLLLLPLPVLAQTADPTPTPAPNSSSDPIPRVHTVAEGENLTYIASLYDITIEDLLALNGLANADNLFVGQTLIVPGGEGEAVATVYTLGGGDTLAQIAAVFNTTPSAILQTNRMISPSQPPAAGQTVTVVSRTGSALPQTITGTPHVVARGETLITIAAQHNIRPAALAAANNLPYPAYLLTGQRLRIPGDAPYQALTGEWQQVVIRPFPIIPGNTVSIYVENVLEGRPSGSFGDQSLQFFPQEGGYAALVGIDAFAEPGLFTLRLEGSGERPWRPFTQQVLVNPGDYVLQQIPVADDPVTRAQEDEVLNSFYLTNTETRQWEGLFTSPVTTTIVTARYGDPRSYAGGPVEIYHSGVDFAGTVGTPILSPANGTVVFNELMDLHGNTVVVDHGQGVLTAYFHLSETFVAVGDLVTAGQALAAGGSTGLSTGPHLHWELRIHGVSVNGLQWLETSFP
ncbi:MAG: LysM peptidoglycan-binding domain-containing protein [Ardenticatenaceae bacterium]|nr:LysM peptidoglycan-binding domain-containing protein [Anaerolineales bacterium]MCB8938653.1 LysM peptidoglycan-binding domain-containing protein [Ardenticatenaceae bacterium]MCB8973889.1 LysM peptidoglycan-binding domain-containing protein [Ardenticatenaceae bacterium]